MPEASGPLTVTVGILTYRRPDTLARGLPAVLAQAEELAAGQLGHAEVRVLVVDNDPAGSARDLVESLARRHPGLVYRVEPTPGIAAGRQRCLEECADARLLVFIDDDEEPEAGWLAGMVRTWQDLDHPAAVAGSVLPRHESPPPAFVLAGGFFDRRRPATGTVLAAAPSGNLLLDMDQVRAAGLRFDPRLGTHGGEDTLFTRQLTRAGGRIVFCREAAIHDLIPPERATRTWVLERARHMGVTHSIVTLLDTGPGVRRQVERLRLLVGGLARAGVGTLRAVTGRLTRSPQRHARGLRLANRGLGMARGALPAVRSQYARSS